MSDAALCAPLCLPCSCFSDTFLPALSLLRRFPRRSIRRFPSVKISSPAARLFPCRRLHRPALLHCAPGQYPVRPASPFHVHASQANSRPLFPPLRRFPRPSARRFPLCEDSPAARPAFPVSEATPACASALRPWTIPCAPRFAFHVHTSQANSLPSGRPA